MKRRLTLETFNAALCYDDAEYEGRSLAIRWGRWAFEISFARVDQRSAR